MMRFERHGSIERHRRIEGHRWIERRRWIERIGWILCGAILSSGAMAAPSIHPLVRPLLIGDTSTRVGVWIRTNDGGRSLESSGLLAAGDRSRMRTARWTPDELRAALSDPSVLAILPAVRCQALLDSSLIECGGRLVHGPHGFPPAYNGPIGTGTIVGIVDTGIDIQHMDFRESGGGTRILGLWDQTVASTDPPRGFSYGKEWTRAQIDAGRSDEIDEIGHGTHVAGIAAGNGSATGNGRPGYRYVGMAPDAQIVFVKTDFLTTSIVDGVKYIFQKADSVGLPAVVNLSLGTQYGPHDGTDEMSLALAELAGPGRVIVAAAGNDQGRGLHARRLVSALRDTVRMTLSVADYTPAAGAQNDEIDLDCWFPPTNPLAIAIRTPNGTLVGPVSMGSAIGTSTPEGRVEIDNTLVGANGDRNVLVQLIDQTADIPPAVGIWRIEVSSEGTPFGSTPFDVWTFWQTMGCRFIYGVDESDLVMAPATGDSVIAVGAYQTRRSWVSEGGTRFGFTPPLPNGELAPFSSNGYRRDGAVKPEISAPGRGIASSLSSRASTIDPHYFVEDGVHVVFEGTSMASPHVAGLIALMFERLGPRGVRGMRSQLTSTARRDAYTGGVPNREWGYGKIDAVRATGLNSPVVLIDAEARQVDDRMEVRFVLSEDAGTAPFPVWREDGNLPGRSLLGWSSSGRERTFVDSTLSASGDYSYWLDISGGGGDSEWIGPARGTFVLPRRLSLTTSPNPFVANASIRWSIPSASGGTVTIHDVAGRAIRSFDCPPRIAGTIRWDGTDRSGRPVAAGLYFARLDAGGRAVERRILRLR